MISTIATIAAFSGVVAASAAPFISTSVAAVSATGTVSGCSPNYTGSSAGKGNFEIQTVNISSIASRKMKRQNTQGVCGSKDTLTLQLQDGILSDYYGRQGYIASNDQLQYDYGTQAGSIVNAGFQACSNGSIALGDSTIFYECLTGNFSNIYYQTPDVKIADYCYPIELEILECTTLASSSSGSASATSSGSSSTSTSSAALTTASSDANASTQTSATPASSAAVVTQSSDGQVVAGSATAAATFTGAAVAKSWNMELIGAAAVVGFAML